ncbi:hypothetical protein POTOM_047457 [Populus tomentosa]|uniref:Uncharacterized protein n=1 Tax=Populus tomentosa TaxID=118781 RepID=A0A8X7YB73_POPTO|nr:hypothetical protein POTOM_047457 [Populus tomentosa]
MASEVTVSSLSRLLQSPCRSGASGDLPHTISCIEDTDGNKSLHMLMPYASMVDGNLELDEDPFVNKTIITPDMSLVNNSSTNRGGDDPDMVLALETLMEADDLGTSELPSAQDIQDVWKVSRKRDGVFFPFDVEQKQLRFLY